MRRQTRALIEIAVLYISVSIVLDYFLGSFQILLFPALAFEFIIFGIMIMSILWEQVAPITRKQEQHIPITDDAFTRLEHLCKMAIDEGDQAAGRLLSERVTSLALAAAANRLNTSEASLTHMQAEPTLIESKIRDKQLFNAMTKTTGIVQQEDGQTLEQLLAKIEAWIT
jgi:hypothetical protein